MKYPIYDHKLLFTMIANPKLSTPGMLNFPGQNNFIASTFVVLFIGFIIPFMPRKKNAECLLHQLFSNLILVLNKTIKKRIYLLKSNVRQIALFKALLDFIIPFFGC